MASQRRNGMQADSGVLTGDTAGAGDVASVGAGHQGREAQQDSGELHGEGRSVLAAAGSV